MLSNPIEELTSYVLINLQDAQNEINDKLKEYKAGDSVKSITTVALGIILKQLISKGD